MLFPTLTFGLFFLIVFALAWELRDRPELHKTFLVAASYVFYSWWDWRFTALLAASSLINFAAGRFLAMTNDPRDRKILLATSVALNLGILGFFKYYGFFLDQLAETLSAFGIERDMPFMEIILPIGISFFTFQGISYVVDVYRRDIEATRSPLDMLLYISFFPQLVAGPIVRASQFLPQLAQTPRLDRQALALGLVLILAGLFKKMVVASYLATELVDPVFFAPDAYSGPDLALAVYGYAVQIYCDFSGYSDIAIGVALLLGYRFSRNFDQPYRAASLREFWTRWHISLSEWLRDYLYKPLGGGRGGAALTVRNVILTMLLGGLWHGASLTFVAWGAIHGFALIAERGVAILRRTPSATFAYAGGVASNIEGDAEKAEGFMPRALGVFVTFNIVCVAWIFFRAQSFETALAYLKGLGDWTGPARQATPFLALVVGFALAAHFAPPRWKEAMAARLADWDAVRLGILVGAGILAVSAIAPEGAAPFIYFRF